MTDSANAALSNSEPSMSPMAPIFRIVYWALATTFVVYSCALVLLINPWVQRHVFYAHKFDVARFYDLNKPEQWGFARNQITPFNFTTPDNQILYAWHVLPLGLYAKHERALLRQPSGCFQDVTQSIGFKLLLDDPEARLIINFHGNAGSIAQGWRPDIYRSLSDGSTSHIHILAVDYRGYGYSSGIPSEEGLLIDGITTVAWAMEVAKIPPERIVIIGHSLGTAVTSAVVEHYALKGTEFAGVVLIAPFQDVPKLLVSYAVVGWIPILSPLRPYPKLQLWFTSYVVDKWSSVTRLVNFVRVSKRVRLFLIHAKNDHEIPYSHSEDLFLATSNATTTGMSVELLKSMKTRSTVDMGDGAFISTWNSGDDKIIREQIVRHGGHNRVMTYAPVALAALQAFGMSDEAL